MKEVYILSGREILGNSEWGGCTDIYIFGVYEEFEKAKNAFKHKILEIAKHLLIRKTDFLSIQKILFLKILMLMKKLLVGSTLKVRNIVNGSCIFLKMMTTILVFGLYQLLFYANMKLNNSLFYKLYKKDLPLVIQGDFL